MKPISNNVFVEKPDSANATKFEIVDSSEFQYKVTQISEDVTKCNVGDFILFVNSDSFRFEGKEIKIVNEDDIKAIKSGQK